MKANYISYDEYRKICQENGEGEGGAQEALASYLHSLGIALNYKDDHRLRDTHVLNPRWVTEGIYMILNAEDLAKQKGELQVDALRGVLNPDDYPPERHGFLLSAPTLTTKSWLTLPRMMRSAVDAKRLGWTLWSSMKFMAAGARRSAEHATFEAPSREPVEARLDRVEPGARGRGVVEHEAWAPAEPAQNFGMLVGAVVVEDDVDDLADRDRGLDGVQEADELLTPMALRCSGQ